MKKYLSLTTPYLFGVAFAVLAWYRLVVLNSDLLYEAQEQNFWQPGSLYLQEMLLAPGGWLSWVGRYLTQYFYYPALGASLLISLWLIIYALTLFGTRLPWYLSWVGLIAPMILLWAETSLGYHIYNLKVPDWWFTPTLYVLLFSALVAMAHWMNKWVRGGWTLVCVLTCFFVLASWEDRAQLPKPLQSLFYPMLDDANFRAEMRMEHAIEEGRWEDALTHMKEAGNTPTRAMWLFKNIALLNQGELLNKWLDYPCLTKLPVCRDSVYVSMADLQGPLIYFMHGSVEFSYRWTMEAMVEYGPSVKRLRTMTRCALVKEEWDLAEKYLNLLSRTKYHKEWAEQHRQYLYHPELIADDKVMKLAKDMSESRLDVLDGDASMIESYIAENYSNEVPRKSAALSELGVIYAMQSQEIEPFWDRFFGYVYLHDTDKDMPILLQEAIYLFVQLEPQSAPRTDFPFDPSVPKRYAEFSEKAQHFMKEGYRGPGLGKAMQHEFGRTYFWFYYFCREQKTY